MKIKLTKKYAVHFKELPKGAELSVTNELGKELIAKKVAKALDGDTQEESYLKQSLTENESE